ncbi:MAG: FmdE family protein [Mangrovibacterium sp.]|jgi:formylmethanofuran dehydrogenase subunit E
MKHLAFFYLLFLLSFRLWSNPIHIEAAYNIIIDTDCAIDDMRAISLMLSQPALDIKAILLSDGSLSPDEGAGKINALLCKFGRDTIPVGVGTVLPGVNPPWRRFNQQLNWRLSQILDHVYAQPAVQARLYENHFRLDDDLVAVYILEPELFDMRILKSGSQVRTVRDYDSEAVKELIDDLVKEKFVMGESVAFNKFPVNRELCTYDVRQIMDSAITKYGAEEWKANVMTDEFHGHLGVFSIVGAKMGTRARELLGADRDELEVISFAGTEPPYSCMNDGIQVSTGATLGMGMIRLAEDSTRIPAAIFNFKEHSVKLSLKTEYLQQLDKDIEEAIHMFGLADEGYWHLVRRNAIKYWLDWDRSKIFDVEEMKNRR